MKKLFPLIAILTILISSCSKCYECIEYHEIVDGQGNVIDTTQVQESVCTANQEEIRKRESNGAVCS